MTRKYSTITIEEKNDVLEFSIGEHVFYYMPVALLPPNSKAGEIGMTIVIKTDFKNEAIKI